MRTSWFLDMDIFNNSSNAPSKDKILDLASTSPANVNNIAPHNSTTLGPGMCFITDIAVSTTPPSNIPSWFSF